MNETRSPVLENEATYRYLAFSLCHEDYAIELLRVREVIALTEITPVPYTPPHFKGIMNLRGQLISIVDLRLKFKMSKAEVTPETAIIILDISGMSLGVIVDSVNSVLTLKSSEVSEAPDIESSIRQDYLSGVARKDKKLILLLDIEKSLSIEELKLIRNQLKNVA